MQYRRQVLGDRPLEYLGVKPISFDKCDMIQERADGVRPKRGLPIKFVLIYPGYRIQRAGAAIR